MKKSIALLTMIGLTTLLLGCTSMKERANQLVMDGHPDQALKIYDDLLKENPKDSEAQVGQQLARERWIENGLIQTRLLRIGNNFEESEKRFRETIVAENEWRVFPKGAAFSAQKDELEAITERFQQKANEAIATNKPFKAEFLLREYSELLSPTTQYNFNNFKSKILQAGQRYCQKFRTTLNKVDFYTQIYEQEACNIWKAKPPPVSTQNSVRLFKSLSGQYDIAGLNDDLKAKLNESVQKAFEHSKWHDPQATNIWQVNIAGNYQNRVENKTVTLSKDYSVQVPYEEKIVKAKEPPPTGVLGLLSVIASLSSDRREVDNGDGTVTVTETRYRTEWKKYSYSAVEFDQNLAIQLQFRSKLSGQTFETSFASKFNQKSYEHSTNFPSIGLVPETRQLVSDDEWVKLSGEALFEKLSADLGQAWEKYFCTTYDKDGRSLPLREQVHRCTYIFSEGVASGTPAFVDEWFRNELGISYEQYRKIL